MRRGKWAILLIASLITLGFMLRRPPAPARSSRVAAAATDRETYLALARASARGDAGVEATARALLQSPSILKRRAALRAFGELTLGDDEVREAFRAALTGGEPALRAEALSALGRRPGPLRAEMLRNFIAGSGEKDADKPLACASLYRAATDPKEKRRALAALLAIPGAGALTEALAAAPDAPEVKARIQSILEAGEEPGTWPLLFRRLAITEPSEARRLYGALLSSSRPETRIAALRSIPRTCLAPRWNWLVSAYQAETAAEPARAALEAISAMPGPAADAALLWLSGAPGLASEKKRVARSRLLELRKHPPGVDPCAGSPADPFAPTPKPAA